MRVARFAALVGAALALAPLPAGAQAAPEEGDLLVRVNGPVTVAPGETARNVVVVNREAVVRGTAENLVVINGTARVEGTVTGAVTVMNGRAELGPAAVVGGDLLLYRSTLERAPGARVVGGVHHEAGISFSARAAWFFWASFTLFMVVAALAFAFVAEGPLAQSAGLLARRPGASALTGFAVAGGLPVLAVFAFMTVLGIPLGFGILLFLVPALAFLGYLVAGTALGAGLLRRSAAERPYASAVVGVTALQLVMLVPWIGGPLALLAGILGTGAMGWRLVLARRSGEGLSFRPARAPAPQPA